MRRLAAALAGVFLITGCALGAPTPAPTEPFIGPAYALPRQPAPTLTPVPIAPDDGHGVDPRLMTAFEKAKAAGAAQGHEFSLNSSYRSPSEQQALVEQSIVDHGSVDEARKWVMSPWDSAHVRGVAIDIQGTPEGQQWLWDHQAEFGICRRYANEPWHFELQASFADNTCPALRASAGE